MQTRTPTPAAHGGLGWEEGPFRVQERREPPLPHPSLPWIFPLREDFFVSCFIEKEFAVISSYGGFRCSVSSSKA